MQATVFDFTFKLRDRPREIYILPFYNVIMSMNFRVVQMGRIPKSFKLTVGVSDGVDTRSLDEVYGDAPFRKYNRAIYGYLGIVRLGEGSANTYQPKFLIGPSHYPKVMVGRLYDHRGFLKTFDTYILTPYQAKGIVTFPTKPFTVALKPYFPAKTKTIGIHHSRGIISDSTPTSVVTGGRLARIGESKFYGIIENKNPKVFSYSERVPLFKGVSMVGHFSYIMSIRSFEKLQMETLIHLTFASSVVDIIPSLSLKYVILSVNKNILNVPAEKSAPSRMNVSI